MNTKRFFIRVAFKVYPRAFFLEDARPIRCTSCGSKKIDQKIVGTVDTYGPVSEYYEFCADCGAFANDWAYGYYCPSVMRPEPWQHIFGGLFNE